MLVLFVSGAALTVQGQQHLKGLTPFVTDSPMVHDPVMAYEDSTYYLFATGMGIQQMTSKDRHSWTVLREPVMTVIPQWAHDLVPGSSHNMFGLPISSAGVVVGGWPIAAPPSAGTVRPSVCCLPVHYLIPSGTMKVVSITSRENRDNWNAIDPNFVIDDQDQPWLVWGSFWDGIQLARLDTTMNIAKGRNPAPLPVGIT